MGFAAAVSVPDGVAIATDSRVVAGFRAGPPSVMSDTQQKIVPLSSHVAAIAPEPYFAVEETAINVRSVLEQIRPDLAPDAKLDDALAELPGRFLSAAGVDADAIKELPLKIIGYGEKDRSVQVVLLDGLANPKPMHSTANPGLDWFGFTDVATRLVKGVPAVTFVGTEPAAATEYVIPVQLMSLADALDLAETFIRTTATFGKFVRAIAVEGREPEPIVIDVGGAVQSAVVTPSGFQWVSRPVSVATPTSPGDLPHGS